MAVLEDQFTDLHRLQKDYDDFMVLDNTGQLEAKFLSQQLHHKFTVAGLQFNLAPDNLTHSIW